MMLGAVLAPNSSRHFNWVKRILSPRKAKVVEATATLPKIENEEGWTLISAHDPEAFGEWLGKDEEGLPFRPDESPSLGSHLLIELFDCDKASLEREDVVGVAMRDAAVASKATVVEQSFHEFKPFGVSGAVIIQESHYTIHTWPEHGYAAVDLFYCGGTVLVHKAVDVLRERFKPGRVKFLVVRRGIENEVAPNK
jgi:S-adenosylmethionine decarboxylase